MKSSPFAHDRLSKGQRKFFHGKLTGHIVSQVGGPESITLEGIYDKDQYWFSFMAGALFLSERRDDSKAGRELNRQIYQYRNYAYRYQIKQGLAEPIAVKKEYRKLVNYDNPDQLQLPFYEARKLTGPEFTKLQKAGFPGFDRDERGRIFKFKVKMAGYKLRHDRRDAREWCEEMCHGRYYITTTYAHFALAHDALLAKLAFG